MSIMLNQLFDNLIQISYTAFVIVGKNKTSINALFRKEYAFFDFIFRPPCETRDIFSFG